MQNLFQKGQLKDFKEKSHGFEKPGALQITILQNKSEWVRCILGKMGWQSLVGQIICNICQLQLLKSTSLYI